MKFVNIDVDEQGHSFFRDVDLPQYGTAQRISSKNQKVLWWKMTQSKPGHFVDFQRAPALMFVAVFSGQMNITVSNGETRHFTRGDMLTMWDNRCTIHYADGGYDGHRRVMHRMTVTGEIPIGVS